MPFELAEDDGLAYVGRVLESDVIKKLSVKNHFDARIRLINIQLEYTQKLTDLRMEIAALQKVSSLEEGEKLEEIDACVQSLQKKGHAELYHRNDRPQSVPREGIITLVM